MTTVLLVIHLLIALAMCGIILIQKSEGGALSGLGGGNFGGMTSGRGAANLLTRTTAILATCFILTSLTLAIIASNSSDRSPILDLPPSEEAAGSGEEAPAGETAPLPLPLPPVAN